MKMRIVCLVAVIIASLPALANAQDSGGSWFITGKELLDFCQYDPAAAITEENVGEATMGSLCTFYIGGVADTFYSTRKLEMLKNKGVCIPDSVEIDQLRTVVLKSLKAKPELHQGPAAATVMVALYGAYPCGP